MLIKVYNECVIMVNYLNATFLFQCMWCHFCGTYVIINILCQEKNDRCVDDVWGYFASIKQYLHVIKLLWILGILYLHSV